MFSIAYRLLVVLVCMTGGTESVEQSCYKFNSVNYFLNTYDGPEKAHYVCHIDANLENDQEEVTTDTSKNTKSNEDVTAVWYACCNTVKFIPNSLFSTFTSLEYLYISFNNVFDTIKQEYLRNATNLKCLVIYNNSVKKLDKNVFSEANSLEHINFLDNEIESIHKKTFNGLPNLQGVYLQMNKIKSLHPSTFSSIVNLNILVLYGDENCVDEKFLRANRKFPEIERKILKSCTYEPFPGEVLEEIEHQKVQLAKVYDMINDLKAVAQDFVVKIANQLLEIINSASEKIYLNSNTTELEAN